ncbi:hypothetical protein GGI12_003342 [Dipsacomyces acuminosporus]|nr:hypothetical protein GGI12_003342 [Dipsacomyces acuminosporus]
MKISLAIGVLGALAQVSVAHKCHNSQVSHATSEVPSVTTPVYPTQPAPVPSSSAPAPATSADVPAPSTPAPYSTVPASVPSDSAPASAPVPATSASTPAYPTNAPSAHAITVDQLNKALPKGATNCSGAGFKDECVPNDKAVAALNSAFTKYGITRRGEAVAVISLIAFESGTWFFNKNHFPAPGRPGQGTRSMMMYNFIEEYARSLYPEKVAAIVGSSGQATDDQKNQVRELVLNDNDSFGSGFWYLVSKAKEYHNNPAKLRDGSASDFKDYCSTGVGAGWEDARLDVWKAVDAAITSF